MKKNIIYIIILIVLSSFVTSTEIFSYMSNNTYSDTYSDYTNISHYPLTAQNTNYEYDITLDTKTGNNGVLTGYIFNHGIIQSATRTTGVFGNAYNYDGINDYIFIAHNNILNSSALDLTFSTWIKAYDASPAPTRRWVISKGDMEDASDGSYGLYYQNTGTVGCKFIESDGGTKSAATTITPGSYNYITCLSNSSGTYIFVNGTLKNSAGVIAPSIRNNTRNFLIGANYDAGYERYFNGSIDEVRIYPATSLTETQIQQEMNSANPINSKGLKASYSFEVYNNTHVFDTNNIGIGKDNNNNSQAFYFDNINDYINVSINTLNTNKLTLNVWIKSNSYNQKNMFLSGKGASGTVFYMQTYDAIDEQIKVNIYDNLGTNVFSIINDFFVINDWIMVTLVYNGSQIDIYRNGLHNTTVTGLTGNLRPIDNIYIGGDATIFNGSISQVSIIQEELTSTEILNLYNGVNLTNKYVNYSNSDITRYNVLNGSFYFNKSNNALTSNFHTIKDRNIIKINKTLPDEFEIISTFRVASDSNTHGCFLGLRENSINSIYLYNKALWVKFNTGTYNITNITTTNNVTIKIIKDSTNYSFYYSTNYGKDWILGYTNLTSNTQPTLNTNVHLRDNHNSVNVICEYNNLVIRERLDMYQNKGITINPSFLYDYDNVTIYWYKDNTLTYTDSYSIANDFMNYPRTLTTSGIWYINVSVCNNNGCVWNISNILKISLGSINISIYDEQTQLLINDRNITLDLILNSQGFNYSTVSGLININDIPSGDYDIRYDAFNYHPREYYVTITINSTNAIMLYLLNDTASVSDRVIMTVYDQNSQKAQDIIIKIQRNYVSGNVSEFKTVSMTRTNFEGQAALYVQLYDIWYKLIYEYDDEVVKITDPSPFFTTTPEDRVNLGEDTYLSWREYDSVIGNVSFINDSGTIYARFIYIDTNNLLREGCLNVQRITPLELENICYNCTNSASATISCIIDPNLEGQYKAIGLIDSNTSNSWYSLDTGYFTLYDSITFGQEGIFFSAVMVGTLTLMGAGSIAGSILFMLLGLIIVTIMQFVVGFHIGLIYWIVMLAFIVLFLIRRAAR